MWKVRIIAEIIISAFISFITFPVGQKFTYTQIVFGSIAFILFNLVQAFQIFLNKLPIISWVNFGPLLLTELVQRSQVCRPLCSRTIFQFCPQIFYRIEVRALWWPLQYLDFVVRKPFFHNFGSMLGVNVHLEQSFHFLTDVLRCCFNIST